MPGKTFIFGRPYFNLSLTIVLGLPLTMNELLELLPQYIKKDVPEQKRSLNIHQQLSESVEEKRRNHPMCAIVWKAFFNTNMLYINAEEKQSLK